MTAKVGILDRRQILQRRFGIWLAYSALVLGCLIATRCHGQEANAAAPAQEQAPAANAQPPAAQRPAAQPRAAQRPAAQPPAANQAAAGPAAGPEFFTISKEEMGKYTPEYVRQLEGQMRTALTDKAAAAGSPGFQAMQEYYSQYFLRKMAQPDAGLELTELVYDALRHVESVTREGTTASAAVRQALPDLVKNAALRVAGGKVRDKYYLPTARINATMLLASLNRSPAQSGNPPVPEVSVATTLNTLYQDASAPLGVRIVALSGLRRHANLLSTTTDNRVRQFFLPIGKDLLEGKGPQGLDAASVSADARGFLTRYAIDIVRSMGSAEDQGWLAQRLTQIVGDKQSSPIAADYAARTLAKIGEPIQSVTVTTPVVASWAERAARALEEEIEYLKSIDPPKVAVPQSLKQQPRAQGAGGYASGGYGSDAYGPSSSYGSSSYDSSYGSSSYDSSYGSGSYGPDSSYGPGSYGSYGSYGSGAMGARPKQPEEIMVARRRLNARLEALLLGLAGTVDEEEGVTAGLASVASDEARQRVDEILETFHSAVDQINSPTFTTRPQFMEMLQEQSKELNYWLVDYGTPVTPQEEDADALPEDETDAAPPREAEADVAVAN